MWQIKIHCLFKIFQKFILSIIFTTHNIKWPQPLQVLWIMVPNDSSAMFCGFLNDLQEKDGTISTVLTSVLSLYEDFKGDHFFVYIALKL